MDQTRIQAALNWIIDSSTELHPTTNLDETLDRYLSRLVQWMRADQGSILLVDGDQLALAATAGLDHIRPGARMSLQSGLAGEVVSSGTAQLIQGPRSSERAGPRPESAAVIPIRAQERIVGVLNLGRLTGAAEFTPEDLQVLTIVATQLGWILSNFEIMSKMWTLAITDELTGLFNRRYFYLRLQEEIQRNQRYDKGFCLVLLDLDGFKELNRFHGHLAGDKILGQLCTALRTNLRAIDLAARYGGDEIVLLLPETGPEEALRIMTRLQVAITERVFVGRDGIPVKLGFCAGIAQFPLDGRSPDDLLQRADEALLEAKAAGTGRLVLAD